MSPEVARGERADPRADIYSLGLVLYSMLVGRGPFDTGNEIAEPPSRFMSGHTSPLLDAAVLRAIEEAPASRYDTAADFHAALRRALHALIP